MAKGSGKSLAAIQRLLSERVEIERWLERLSLSGDSTPEAVRDRIRNDYQARLKELLKELSGYGNELNEALKRQLMTREGLARQEKEATERLAEAEVRHAVGEYDEARWRQMHAEYLGTQLRLREELKNVDEEIERLEDAVNSLTAKSGKSVSVPPAPAPPPPAPPPPSAAKPAGKQTDAFDELAFLKSVTDDEKTRPNAGRASGVQRVPESIKPPDEHKGATPPAPPPPPPPVAAPPPPISKPSVDVGASGVAPIDSTGPGKRMTAQLEKSLKCKECGTMNQPTEWYCEKCGAELSESL